MRDGLDEVFPTGASVTCQWTHRHGPGGVRVSWTEPVFVGGAHLLTHHASQATHSRGLPQNNGWIAVNNARQSV